MTTRIDLTTIDSAAQEIKRVRATGCNREVAELRRLVRHSLRTGARYACRVGDELFVVWMPMTAKGERR